jgi:transcriptional regulator with XRE-family HTH domain
MAEPEHILREKLAAVFARQDLYEACLRQDAGAMVTIFEAGKVTQGQLAALTGIAQSTLSNYKRGVNTAKFASTFEKLADGTDMPPRLRQALGLSGEAPARSRPAAGAMAGVPADTFDLQLLAETIGRNGTAVRRRDLLALAAQLAAPKSWTASLTDQEAAPVPTWSGGTSLGYACPQHVLRSATYCIFCNL